MKVSKQCPKCRSLRIGRIGSQPDTAVTTEHKGATIAVSGASERAAGLGPTVDTGMLRWGEVATLVGSLEAYVCADCGYYESYVVDPAATRWDLIRDFAWLNEPGAGAGPYR